MSERNELHGGGPQGDPQDSSNYDRWFDGLLEDGESRRLHARVASDAHQRERFEADCAIDASLRRSFAGEAPRSGLPADRLRALPRAAERRNWTRYAAAAVVLILGAAALALLWGRQSPSHPGEPGSTAKTTAPTNDIPVTFVADARTAENTHITQLSPGDVFLDALAQDFQPLLGCQVQDAWEARLYAQLTEAPCNLEQGVVVLGEWVDPRLDVANVLMLRRGDNPIMLVVPRCEQDTELCVAKDSGLYVHRGMRDGRRIYEISPVPGSEILECVDAENVVTQQSL